MKTTLEQLLAAELSAGNAPLKDAMADAEANTIADFIQKSPKALSFIKEQALEICIEAVRQHKDALQFVSEQNVKHIPVFLRLEAAESPNVSHKTLDMLTKDESEAVRMKAASNPQASSTMLEKLGQDKALGVRWRVAENLNTPPALLNELAKDENISIQARVAQNPNTPSDTLALLAKGSSDIVCMVVAENPNTSPKVLAALVSSQDKMVSSVASRAVKAKIPNKIGNVDITPEQRQALQEGKSVTLSGLVDKAGNVHNTVHVAFDKEANKIKLLQERSTPKSKQNQATAREKRPQKQARKGGMTM
ncbi:MAG: DUF3945 domain-containing protein [Prevotellaceae bacterium]|jgi:hypothetical protein|nr:DUF3945 domain-containing protein [Prevotellaceae bacterium]